MGGSGEEERERKECESQWEGVGRKRERGNEGKQVKREW